MNQVAVLLSVRATIVFCPSWARPAQTPRSRRAGLADPQAIDRAQLVRINLAPGQATGAHHHPCDVVGMIISGRIRFRIDGENETLLGPGAAFFEPRNAPVVQFDNASDDEAAVFLACYLLPPDQTEIIVMTPPPAGQ